MAAVSFLLAPVQSNLTVTPSPPPDAEATDTPVNANQAQGAPVPLDTVTLAAQTAQGQGTGQNQQDGQFQSSPGFAVAAALFANASSATSQNGNADLQQAAATPSQPDLAQTQKQELQQLDETLRQLGIDPQSISVFNQLAMLFYSNNPSGLQQFIRQFQSTAQKVLQQGIPTSAAASQTAPQVLSASGDAAGSPGQAAHGSSQTTVDSGNQSNAVAQQFQELQFAVAAVGGQVQLPSPASAPSPPVKESDKSLDVTL